MPAKSDLEAQPESDGVAEKFQGSKEPRNPLSHLAAQFTHAVRNVFPGEQLREQDGHVQRTRQAADRVDIQPEQCTDPQFPVLTSEAAALQDESAQSEWSGEHEAIVAEAARVKAKFASLDAKTEVVLRFDFMNETDTKARDLQLTSYRMALYIHNITSCAAGCKQCDVCCYAAGLGSPGCRVHLQNESGKWHTQAQPSHATLTVVSLYHHSKGHEDWHVHAGCFIKPFPG